MKFKMGIDKSVLKGALETIQAAQSKQRAQVKFDNIAFKTNFENYNIDR